MPFLQAIAKRWPLPSVRDLEVSHFELQSGPYPKFDAFTEKQAEEPEQSKLEQRAAKSINWLSRAFARSPKAINEKREALLPQTRECSSSRSSTDAESQASTDASTSLDTEREEKRSGRIDPRVISDAIIGLSDGRTVPFALTAGLSALGNTIVVIFAGLAELTAGAISMGLGGYLGAKSEELIVSSKELYKATFSETAHLVSTSSSDAATSIKEVFQPFDIPQDLTEDLTFYVAKSPHLVQFLMHFQHAQPEQAASRAISSALTIACGYFLGGFIPLLPYFLVG